METLRKEAWLGWSWDFRSGSGALEGLFAVVDRTRIMQATKFLVGNRTQGTTLPLQQLKCSCPATKPI